MWLSPRLALRKRRLRNQEVPRDGRPLTERERFDLEVARFALIDEEGTRRVALDEQVAEMTAAGGDGE